MNVAKFLGPLLRREDIEIVVARLSERALPTAEFPRHQLLKHLHGGTETVLAWLAYQQMYVLGHDNVSKDGESVPLPDVLQCLLEDFARRDGVEQRQATMTTEGDEVVAAEMVVTLETRGHVETLAPVHDVGCDVGRFDWCGERICPTLPFVFSTVLKIEVKICALSHPTLTPKEG